MAGSKVGATEKAPALWAHLRYSDSSMQAVKGFAIAWTNSMVQVEYSMARTAWVNANVVQRRKLEDRLPYCDC